jgi:hypothetical protein
MGRGRETNRQTRPDEDWCSSSGDGGESYGNRWVVVVVVNGRAGAEGGDNVGW